MIRIFALVFFSIINLAVFAQSSSLLNDSAKALLTKRDFKNALPVLKKAAELGNAEAQYNYGCMYEEGKEVSKNDTLANVWFLRSAKQGWKDAQFKMSYSYAVGRAVQADMSKAFTWALQCAKQDDAECIWNVLNCYYTGNGAIKNIDSVMYWAIKLGSFKNTENLQVSSQVTNARLNLAKMYYSGDVIKKDLHQSYVWYLLYNEKKKDHAVFVQEESIKTIKEIEALLSAADKENARKEAETLLKSPLQNLGNIYKTDL